jgi:triacylglycerol lipase
MKFITLLFLIISSIYSSECVVLLHGLGRTNKSLNSLENYLKRKNYSVYNINYPSTKLSIEDICSKSISKPITDISKKYDTLNFVTHSMGGIVLRYYLQNSNIKCGKIVMIAPPNQGSELSNQLKKNVNWLYYKIDGPSGQQLGTDSMSIIRRLDKLKYRIGIIAGDKSLEPWFKFYVNGRNDGKVKIEECKLAEMSDFIVLNHTHTFMMNSKDTKFQVYHFLKYGVFKK